MKNIRFEIILLLAYQLIGLTPYFGAINKIGPQYFFLSILNFIAFIRFTLDSNTTFYKLFSNISLEIRLFFFFFLSSFLSCIYAISLNEALITTSKILIILISIFIISYNLKKLGKLNFYINFILIPSFILYLYFPVAEYFHIINLKQYQFSDATYLKTYTGNKNVLAALVSILLSFSYFLLNSNKFNVIRTLFFAIVSFVSVFLLFIISSRAALLGYFISIIVSLLLIFRSNKFKDLKYVFFFTLPVFFLILINSTFSKNSEISLIDRASTISSSDTSTQERLKFYLHGFQQIIEKPLTGVGIGNWKIKSIEYDKPNLLTYRVPYHMHNDFIQYFAEVGIVGGSLYASIFIILFLFFWKNTNSKNFKQLLPVLMALIAISVDSMLNFTHDRPVLMIQFAFVIGLINLLKSADT